MTTLSYFEDANYTNRSNTTAAWTAAAYLDDYGNKSNSSNETTAAWTAAAYLDDYGNNSNSSNETTPGQIWNDVSISSNLSNDTDSASNTAADQNTTT